MSTAPDAELERMYKMCNDTVRQFPRLKFSVVSKDQRAMVYHRRAMISDEIKRRERQAARHALPALTEEELRAAVADDDSHAGLDREIHAQIEAEQQAQVDEYVEKLRTGLREIDDADAESLDQYYKDLYDAFDEGLLEAKIEAPTDQNEKKKKTPTDDTETPYDQLDEETKAFIQSQLPEELKGRTSISDAEAEHYIKQEYGDIDEFNVLYLIRDKGKAPPRHIPDEPRVQPMRAQPTFAEAGMRARLAREMPHLAEAQSISLVQMMTANVPAPDGYQWEVRTMPRDQVPERVRT